MNFYPLTIKNIRKETADCVSISFNIPAEIKYVFAYKQGQYITLKTKIDEQEIRRSYSLCSSPLEDDFRIAVKRVDGGLFSTFANHQLQVNDVLEVAEPNGKFYSELNKSCYINLSINELSETNTIFASPKYISLLILSFVKSSKPFNISISKF
jgi:ring-1,2-phenylacetyl-CoA epoxidase subunit PaaE